MAIEPIKTDKEGYGKFEEQKPLPPAQKEYDLREDTGPSPKSWKEKIAEGARSQAAQWKEEWRESRERKAAEEREFREAERMAYRQAKVQAVKVRGAMRAREEVLAPRRESSGGLGGFSLTGSHVPGTSGISLVGGSGLKSKGSVSSHIGGVSVTGGSSVGTLSHSGASLLGGGLSPVKAPSKKKGKARGVTGGGTRGLTIHVHTGSVAKKKYKKRR